MLTYFRNWRAARTAAQVEKHQAQAKEVAALKVFAASIITKGDL